jgi:hypothetical protein
MIAPATALLVYVWHYLVARLIYDELLRPLFGGHSGEVVFGALAAGIVVWLLLFRRRGRSRRA